MALQQHATPGLPASRAVVFPLRNRVQLADRWAGKGQTACLPGLARTRWLPTMPQPVKDDKYDFIGGFRGNRYESDDEQNGPNGKTFRASMTFNDGASPPSFSQNQTNRSR
ncbi:hypothetical protein [Janthinobacterium psychrotolerans]|uniref:hypothetical protein n=1 Tax=Janthinobacterium psychrotolerans TaxID=1747903 RepID=UPI001237933B|nr:hypothetical protein [Janthinobacterium psychrotolerans]